MSDFEQKIILRNNFQKYKLERKMKAIPKLIAIKKTQKVYMPLKLYRGKEKIHREIKLIVY